MDTSNRWPRLKNSKMKHAKSVAIVGFAVAFGFVAGRNTAPVPSNTSSNLSHTVPIVSEQQNQIVRTQSENTKSAENIAGMTLIPSAALRYLRVQVLTPDLRLHPQLLLASGISEEEASEVNSVLQKVREQITVSARNRMFVTSAQGGTTNVHIPPMGEMGAQLREHVLQTITSKMDAQMAELLRPRVADQLDSGFDYFGRYIQEFEVVGNASEASPNAFTVTQHIVFDVATHHMSSTAYELDKARLVTLLPVLSTF